MSKLYQCPYDKATTCDLNEPCFGCETFSEFLIAQGENSNVSDNVDEKEEFIKLCMCDNPEYKDGKCINCGDADWEF